MRSARLPAQLASGHLETSQLHAEAVRSYDRLAKMSSRAAVGRRILPRRKPKETQGNAERLAEKIAHVPQHGFAMRFHIQSGASAG